MESATNDTLAGNLRRVRETRHLTQEALGHRANVSRNYIASLEVGRITNPGVFKVYRLARALGVTVEALLGRPALDTASVRAHVYTLADAQRELEARLALVGAEPFEAMTPAQATAYLPSSIDSEELMSAAQLAITNHLPASRTVPDEWAAQSWYAAGAIAMAIRAQNDGAKLADAGSIVSRADADRYS
jgi:transcriptional regulator with XRE-family HTH domain